MTVVICADHASVSAEFDLLGSEAVAVPNLCRDPSWLTTANIDEIDALILHAGDYDLGSVQGAIRKCGVDPLGVPVVALSNVATTEQITTIASGVVARHRSFQGSEPRHAKMQWPRLMSRRRMFALGVPHYIGAPGVDPGLCSAEQGCRICIEQCPMSAIKVASGKIIYDVDRCAACGICTSACPTQATVNPTATAEQLAAQITAIVTAARGPAGIEFRCRESTPRPLDDGWFPVEVPCTGMLTIGWLLAPLLLGAGAVAALPCHSSGCSLGNGGLTVRHIRGARAMLDIFGLEAERLPTHQLTSVPVPLCEPPIAPTADFKDASVLLALAQLTSTTGAHTAPAQCAVGMVAVDKARCTACERCVTVCPPKALTATRREDSVEMSFDASLCVGCEMCVHICPEDNAIAVERSLDIEELALGERVIFSGPVLACEVCGGPIAPKAMLDRIGAVLGSEHAGTLNLISRRCLSCR